MFSVSARFWFPDFLFVGIEWCDGTLRRKWGWLLALSYFFIALVENEMKN